ncbi:MAG: hypothetical protein ACKOU7_12570 [Ferruginibacter sp.]
MSLCWNNIKDQKPAIFDWLVFTISLLMGLIFPELKDFAAAASFSYWMLAALLLYTAGLWLKHRPVYYRLSCKGKAPNAVPYLLFLIIGHWVIMLMVILLAGDAVRHIAGLPLPAEESRASGFEVFSSIVGGLFVTWLAFRPGGKIRKPMTENYRIWRETAGDVLLITGISILSFVFWEKSLLASMEHMQLNSFGNILTLFIFLSVCFILFYLPLRYLYLIEEHNSRQMWRRLLLIFMLILLRGLFEAIQS